MENAGLLLKILREKAGEQGLGHAGLPQKKGSLQLRKLGTPPAR